MFSKRDVVLFVLYTFSAIWIAESPKHLVIDTIMAGVLVTLAIHKLLEMRSLWKKSKKK